MYMNLRDEVRTGARHRVPRGFWRGRSSLPGCAGLFVVCRYAVLQGLVSIQTSLEDFFRLAFVSFFPMTRDSICDVFHDARMIIATLLAIFIT